MLFRSGEVVAAISGMKSIDKIVWVGHSWNLGKIDVTKLPTTNLTQNATIYALGCNTGSGNGPDGGVRYSGSRVFGVRR